MSPPVPERGSSPGRCGAAAQAAPEPHSRRLRPDRSRRGVERQRHTQATPSLQGKGPQVLEEAGLGAQLLPLMWLSLCLSPRHSPGAHPTGPPRRSLGGVSLPRRMREGRANF